MSTLTITPFKNPLTDDRTRDPKGFAKQISPYLKPPKSEGAIQNKHIRRAAKDLASASATAQDQRGFVQNQILIAVRLFSFVLDQLFKPKHITPETIKGDPFEPIDTVTGEKFGINYTKDSTTKYQEAKLDTSAEHVIPNYHDAVHGGATSTILDSMMSESATAYDYQEDPRKAVTVNNYIAFIKPMKIEDASKLQAKSRVLFKVGRYYFCKSKIWDSTDQDVKAIGFGVFTKVDKLFPKEKQQAK